MAKYRKKPVVIDAFKWTGGPDQTEDPEWIIEKIRSEDVWFYTEERGTLMVIRTLEGDMTASPGDYIVSGINGDITSYKAEGFEKEFELI